MYLEGKVARVLKYNFTAHVTDVVCS